MKKTFSEFMTENGIEIDHEPIPDGKVHRFGKNKAFWYYLHQKDGFQVGIAGDWRAGNRLKWNSGGDTNEIRKAEKEINRTIKADAKKRESEQAEAAIEARKIFENAGAADPEHPYLTKKQIEPIGDIRQIGDTLIIPCYRGKDRELVSFQRIPGGDSKKLFQKGCSTKDVYFEMPGEGRTAICEGYATGASIYLATAWSVIICFSCHNLAAIAKLFRDRDPIILGDNDAHLEGSNQGNIGAIKAKAAAAKIGTACLIPDEPGDWNDYHAEHGIEKLRDAIITPEPAGLPDIDESDMINAAYDEDDGIANLFLQRYISEYRYDRAGGLYYQWKDNYWSEDRIDNNLRAYSEIAGIVDAVLIEKRGEMKPILIAIQEYESKMKPGAGGLDDGDGYELNQLKKEQSALSQVIKILGGLSKRLKTSTRKRAARELARSGAGTIAMTGEEWDSDNNLLGFKNGVLELDSMKFRPGRRGDYLKSIIPHDFEGMDKRSELWERFLNDVFSGDHALIDFVQTLFGYALSGTCKNHVLPILWGAGRNGKGTLVETLAYCLGESITQKIRADALMKDEKRGNSGGHDADTMSLMGKRLCWGSETAATKRLNISKVKELVGGDTLTARPPHGRRNISFRPTHTVFLLTNNKPIIPPDDKAIWERVILIEFENEYLKDDPGTDPDLPRKLEKESAAIIAWVLHGLLKWKANGNKLGKYPDRVRAAITSYHAENDHVGNFLNDRTTAAAGEWIPSTALYNEFKSWGAEQGLRELEIGTQTKFGKALKSKGYEKGRRGSSNLTSYIGLRLLEPGEERPDTAEPDETEPAACSTCEFYDPGRELCYLGSARPGLGIAKQRRPTGACEHWRPAAN